MKKNPLDLNEIRQKIDALDKQIYQLISQRGLIAKQVGEVKRQEDNPIFYRPEREAQVLRRMMKENDSVLDDQSVAQIFRDIMTACLAVQKPVTIAFLGPEGTFSQQATEKHFGQAVKKLAMPTITRVFREVTAGNAHYGVVPIENSTNGIVNLTLDALTESSLLICGEIEIPIHQHLLCTHTDLSKIKKIYSHEQSLAQCRVWLDEHMPDIQRIAVSSNGEAAKLAEQDETAAAIAGEIAARTYQLKNLVQNIENNPLNTTRFLIIGKQKTAASGEDKTSLLITTPHTPGTLIELIKPFANNNINLTLIESRPYQQRNWSYLFFIDIEGHQDDPAVAKALAELSSKPIMTTILGSYPRAL